MKYRLLGYHYDSPIERIRGSNEVRVSIIATFSIAGIKYQVPGVSMTNTIDNINEATKSALENAIQNVESLVEANSNISQVNNMSNIIKSLIQPSLKEKENKMMDTINNDPKVLDKQRNIDRLQGPADETRQTKINELCEVLGIEPIIVAGDDPWSMLEALALIEELKLKTERFEVRD